MTTQDRTAAVSDIAPAQDTLLQRYTLGEYFSLASSELFEDLSAYGQYTPITVRSRSIAIDANLE
jgi:hypothetical protein